MLTVIPLTVSAHSLPNNTTRTRALEHIPEPARVPGVSYGYSYSTHTLLKSDPLRPKNQPVVLVGVTNVGTSAIYPIPSRPAPPAAHCRQGGIGREGTRRDATPNLHRTRPQRSASPPAVASAHRMVLAAWYMLHVACQHRIIALYTTQLPFVVFRWCRQVDVPQQII